MDRTYARQGWIAALTLLALVAGLHVVFSALGFHANDDGAVLAQSRRLLDGQIPHRDFISTAPAGSALVHIGEVALGGDHALLVSRGVAWLQFGLIAWLWAMMALSPSRAGCCPLPMPGGIDPDPDRATVVRRLVAAAAVPALLLALTSHLVPLIASPVLDAFALWSAASFCLFDGGPRSRVAGFVLAGLAGLCAPEFLPLMLIAPFLWGGGREIKNWLLVLAPATLYFAVIAMLGGSGDFVTQVWRQNLVAWPNEFSGLGRILGFLESTRFWLGIGTGLAIVVLLWVTARVVDERVANLSRTVVGLLITVVLVMVAVSAGDPEFSTQGAYLLFGLGAVMLVAPGADRRGLGAALAAAWCASSSMRRVAPELGAGAIAAMLMRYGGSMLPPLPRAATGGAIMSLVLSVVALAQVVNGRAQTGGGDRPAAEQHLDLAGVLPGAAGIRAEPKTYAVLADLQKWKAKLGGRVIGVVPDVPAMWIASRAPNPLSIDGPQESEGAVPALLQRMNRELEGQRGRMTILVRKGRTLGPEAQTWVPSELQRRGWRPVGESEYFVAYE